ncbi:CBS domain-containing protein [Halalkalibacterium halodurans]|uniref:Inosine-5'-monophosphate dehydrogenase n=1 Tax=Halalkalibacterium halodurans (strain ATCC BAA-125 / DSM 18197 / FERM 7344 / JCM 9153 / C-125) TaxID=272558 RepID=Q9K9D8_HALH5|nr:CBS domain-containing protein [Halalkalibacterium halodurans]MED4080302.1 CBS domain-containing protein [Halalkalibacterium halodurans]MED4084630.1 CBS domain-containing protein [Halalkalibacterium halodurans]MED4103990.1 CBS domain-containing protein [Halalkalibacterium halodurans]MED4108938.1 CBS domain-containing protein [Halalkalibacterium halodurans]MED4125258.1 CBS domain-containing protein [Halalkalibacterium halodurans]
MKIAFFLLPKAEVVYMNEDATMRQVIERMEYHNYTAIPILDKEGKYVGTITEGDLLWKMKHTPNLTFENTESVSLKEIEQKMVNLPVHIDAEIDDLLSLAIAQNFVPVVDDQGIFIGIIRRRDIINYCKELLEKTNLYKKERLS